EEAIVAAGEVVGVQDSRLDAQFLGGRILPGDAVVPAGERTLVGLYHDDRRIFATLQRRDQLADDLVGIEELVGIALRVATLCRCTLADAGAVGSEDVRPVRDEDMREDEGRTGAVAD